MLHQEYNDIIEKVKKEKPIWFALESEEKANEEEIKEIEMFYDIQLPVEYKQFLQEYGGGYFAFVIILTCNKGGAFFIKTKNPEENVKRYSFIAVSDNGVGDLYGFKIIDNICEKKVSLFSHEGQNIEETCYQNFYEYILEKGLGLK